MDAIWIATANPRGEEGRLATETSFATQDEMPQLAEWINRNPIPVFLEHNVGEHVKVGTSVAAEVMQNGELGVAFRTSDSAMGELAETLLDRGHLREVSLGWQIGVTRDPQTRQILGVHSKRPTEISLVQKGDRPNTVVLGRASAYIKEAQKPQNKREMSAPAAAPAPPAPAAAPPAAAPPAAPMEVDAVSKLQQQVQALMEINRQHEERQKELDRVGLERIAQKLDSTEVDAFLNLLKEMDANYRPADAQVRELIKNLKTRNSVEVQALAELISAAASANTSLQRRATDLEREVQAHIAETKRARTGDFAEPESRKAPPAVVTPIPANVTADSDRPVPRNPYSDPEIAATIQRYGYSGARSGDYYNRLDKDFGSLYKRIEQAHGNQNWVDALPGLRRSGV